MFSLLLSKKTLSGKEIEISGTAVELLKTGKRKNNIYGATNTIFNSYLATYITDIKRKSRE